MAQWYALSGEFLEVEKGDKGGKKIKMGEN